MHIRGRDRRRRLQTGLFSGAPRSYASCVCVGGPIAPDSATCFVGGWRGAPGASLPPRWHLASTGPGRGEMPVACGRTFHTCCAAGVPVAITVKGGLPRLVCCSTLTCTRASDESLVIVLTQPCVCKELPALVFATVGPMCMVLRGGCVTPAGG